MSYEYFNAAVALLVNYSDCEFDSDCKEQYLELNCSQFGMTGEFDFCPVAVSVTGAPGFLVEDKNLQERICREHNLYCPYTFSSCSMIKPVCNNRKCAYISCIDHHTECQDAGFLDRDS